MSRTVRVKLRLTPIGAHTKPPDMVRLGEAKRALQQVSNNLSRIELPLWHFRHRFALDATKPHGLRHIKRRHQMSSFRVLAAFTILSAPSLGVAAEPPAPVAKQVVALQTCRTKSDATDRLACYDKAVDELSAAAASQDVIIVERADVRKARKGLFGFSLPRIGFLAGRDGNAEDEADAVRFEGKIVSVRTLETSFSFKTPAPDRVILIERGALGSYSARVGNGGWVRVKRLQ
jgi:hypothetical protein